MEAMRGSTIQAYILAFALVVFFMATSSECSVDTTRAALIRVDQSGNGDYTTIQGAIDAVPSNNSVPVFILIKPGIYREKIVIPADKPFVTLSGTNATLTIITWSGVWITKDSATVSVFASDFVARYLTIQNTYGPGGQAIALQVMGDRAAFYTCRLLSYQDTLLDDSGRHYYRNCYIEGATDFICGNGLALFEKCHIRSISKVGGAITAQRRTSASQNTGFSFLNCTITGVGAALLGRPWGAYSKTVFAYSYMSNVILPQGWDDWGVPSNQKTVFYGQYKCYGPGSKSSGRVGWSHELSDTEALKFTDQSMINGQDWIKPLPTNFCKAATMFQNQVQSNG